MNKYKQNLAELRKHLNRDERGLKLLDAIARDITEQRKRIAELEAAEIKSSLLVNTLRKETAHANSETIKVKEALEAEKTRMASAKINAERLAGRIAEMESRLQVEDEAPGDRVSANPDASIPKIKQLFKDVRKRFNRIPPSFGTRQIFRLEDFIKDFTGDEFMGLGMILAALAFYNVPASVQAERPISDMKGWTDNQAAKFFLWYSPWCFISSLEAREHPGTRCFVRKGIKIT